MTRATILGGAFVVLLAVATISSGQQVPERLPEGEATLPSMLHCPVEGHEVETDRFSVRWNGRRYYLGTETCQEKFLADPERYARHIEPRGALFQASSPASYGPAFLFGAVFVVVGFVFGGLASYLAVQKARPAPRWFAAGFAFNILGLAWIASQPSLRAGFGSEGLTKIPQTHPPSRCESCDAALHPSARECPRCGSAHEASTTSEAERLAD